MTYNCIDLWILGSDIVALNALLFECSERPPTPPKAGEVGDLVLIGTGAAPTGVNCTDPASEPKVKS